MTDERSTGDFHWVEELVHERARLLRDLVTTASAAAVLSEGPIDASSEARQSWIERAGAYVTGRQLTVDRLVAVDAEVGPVVPLDQDARAALEEVLAADRQIGERLTRELTEVQREIDKVRVGRDAARAYLQKETLSSHLLHRTL